ncbi:MAG TPA: MCE family protein [Nocardia sp.]|uniref:MCE family protein n=1 Tax=Nocardia sp. TaxID=1821 RepID=UPI002B4AC69F|nr:MCE family protein [Nocardia sp.]HLS76020.1 MCE family protein [Nocardia sp.]
MNRATIVRRAAALALIAALAAAGTAGWRAAFGPRTLHAVFTTATAIYPGDDVRVSGVAVGVVTAIEPRGTTVEMTLEIDRDLGIPADAQAVIVAQSLVDSRYVQLTPAYRGDGPTLPDGATIPLERTAVPVEWDEVKTQLTRLSAALGPDGDMSSSSLGRFIDSAAAAMDGNGGALRETLRQLSGVGRILADGSGDIVTTIAALQQFVTTLRDSNVQIVEFQDRLATLTSVLDGSRSDLDAALHQLSLAVTEVRRFVADNRDRASEQVGRLVNLTQNLVDNRDDLEQLLHVFPTSMANFYNIYNPESGTEAGVFVLNNFSNPVQFICSAIEAVGKQSSAQSAQTCRDYLGPVLPLLSFNYLPVSVNPVLGPTPRPERVLYTEPHLVPRVVAPAEQAPPPPLDLTAILFGGRR